MSMSKKSKWLSFGCKLWVEVFWVDKKFFDVDKYIFFCDLMLLLFEEKVFIWGIVEMLYDYWYDYVVLLVLLLYEFSRRCGLRKRMLWIILVVILVVIVVVVGVGVGVGVLGGSFLLDDDRVELSNRLVLMLRGLMYKYGINVI